jgi:multidrug efflux system outer membrane protein
MKPSPSFVRPPRQAQALGLVALAAVLAGCSLVPPYERPAAPVARDWPAAAARPAAVAGERAAADLPWQDFVQDQALRELIELALANNRDLRVAVQSIEQARAQFRIRRADQLPTVAGALSGERSEPNPSAGDDGPKVNALYTVGLGVVGWELDFFGRVAALGDAALAAYLASEEARKSVQISVIASVAATWLQLKTDTELLALAERTLATRRQSLSLVRLRFEHGASSALDLRQAESLVAAAQVARAQQQRLRAQDINLLTLLVGATPPERLIPALPPAEAEAAQAQAQAQAQTVLPVLPVLPALPGFAPLPAGLPSDLLLHRPDIRAAEQRLIAANANIGAARANFFPRITLTASLGRVSRDLEGLLGSGGSGAWSFGPSVTLPIFDGGRNQANLEAAQAGRAIAVTQYEHAIQSAFREVADALASRDTMQAQLAATGEQAQAERARVALVDLRYRNGVASHLELLDAQRSLFAIEQALALAQLAQRVADVQLYKALGGGWLQERPAG